MASRASNTCSSRGIWSSCRRAASTGRRPSRTRRMSGASSISRRSFCAARAAAVTLTACFDRAREEFRFVVHPGGRHGRRRSSPRWSAAEREEAFGQELLAQVAAVPASDRAAPGHGGQSAASTQSPRPTTGRSRPFCSYLSEHLTEPVSIDDLAARFYISKYHMMRRFRAADRLYHPRAISPASVSMLAREQIAAGTPVLQAASECGFGDYSAFLRAYRQPVRPRHPVSAKRSAPKRRKNRKSHLTATAQYVIIFRLIMSVRLRV